MSTKDPKQLSPEELLKMMEDLGVNPNQWHKTKPTKMKSPLHDQQVEAAEMLKKALLEQEKALQSELVRAKELLYQVKNGGGV